jgi:flagellar biosynthesis protein FliR
MTYFYPEKWISHLNILVILLRFLGFFFLVPGFSHNSIPATFKILLAVALSLALYPIVMQWLPPVGLTLDGIVFIALRESSIGLIMGFAAYITFEAVNLAAQMIGYQMGFGSAGLMDPQNHSQVSIIVPFQGWLLLMVFFLTDMHHQLIRVFVLSFEATKGFDAHIVSQGMLKYFINLSGRLFILAVQMSAPFTLLVLATNVAMGVLSRVLPQMNVLLFTFPITMLLGFALLYIIAPELFEYMDNLLNEVVGDLGLLLRNF